MLNGVNGTSFYYSVTNPYTLRFLRDMELPITNDYTYIDMDRRSIIEAMIGCRYVVVKSGEETYLPYGYNSLYTTDGYYSIYTNDMGTPDEIIVEKIMEKFFLPVEEAEKYVK